MGGEEEKNSVGRPTKRYLSWLILRKYDEDGDVNEWIGDAEECVKLLKLTNEDAASFVFTI